MLPPTSTATDPTDLVELILEVDDGLPDQLARRLAQRRATIAGLVVAVVASLAGIELPSPHPGGGSPSPSPGSPSPSPSPGSPSPDRQSPSPVAGIAIAGVAVAIPGSPSPGASSGPSLVSPADSPSFALLSVHAARPPARAMPEVARSHRSLAPSSMVTSFAWTCQPDDRRGVSGTSRIAPLRLDLELADPQIAVAAGNLAGPHRNTVPVTHVDRDVVEDIQVHLGIPVDHGIGDQQVAVLAVPHEQAVSLPVRTVGRARDQHATTGQRREATTDLEHVRVVVVDVPHQLRRCRTCSG